MAPAESSKQRDKLEAQRQALTLEPAVAGFLGALPRLVHVAAIAEDWCGDVAAAREKVAAEGSGATQADQREDALLGPGQAILHIKQWRGIATRCAKNLASFLAAVQIRCLALRLKIS